MGQLTVWLFGRPRCKTPFAEAALPARPGARALFVALAYANHPLERSWLAASLWPDVTDTVAGANLRRHVVYVEQWLRALTGCDQPIRRTRGLLALDRDMVEWVDVRAFEDAVAHGAFAEAARLYSGDLLANYDDEWIHPERARLQSLHGEVLASLVESARARGESEAALRYARIARERDAYDETWLRTTMRVRFAAGDRAGALAEYETYRDLVARELDVEPLPETSMLAASMRRLEQDTTFSPAAVEATTFIGRAREERLVRELMTRERLVTISGEPGIGKTRLLLRCVRAIASDHRDGSIVVDAGAANNEDALERALLRSLRNNRIRAGETLEEEVANLDIIVAFDGCERVAAACAALATRVLAASATVCVVTSSRVALGAANEVIVRLGPLDAPDAARLFTERVRAVRNGNTDLDPATVARIAKKLDGLPLALELAAARARVSSLAEVERDVRRYTGRPGLDVLYATYESSYDLLAPLERAVLRRLATFENGWTGDIALAACAALANAGAVLAAISTLVEHSLVVPPGVLDGVERYCMLDATRDFALSRSRLLGQVGDDARAHAIAVAEHYAAIGKRLRAEHAADYYPACERDRENIDASLKTLWAGDANDRALAIDQSLALSRFWADQGSARNGEVWLRKALDELGPSANVQRLELLRVIATLTRDLGDYAASFADFDELVRTHTSAGSSEVEIAKAQTMAANAARMLGDFDEALRRTRLAQTAFEKNGEAYLTAWAIYALGTTLLSAGRFTQAADELERATEMFNGLGAVADSSSSIANLALSHYYCGRHEVALELTRESLARANAADHRYYYAHAALNEALISHEFADAEPVWSRVVEAGAIGASLGAYDVTISCAEVAAALLTCSHPAAAACLIGSVENARERIRAPRFPVEIPLYRKTCDSLLAALGEEGFAASCARGRVTPLRDAVARLADFDFGAPARA